MTPVVCRYFTLGELFVGGRNAAGHWLSPAESSALEAMRSAERRRTWLAGRIAAKRLLLSSLAVDMDPATIPASADIHIESRSGKPAHGERPVVYFRGQLRQFGLSIAHTTRGVLVAVSLDAALMPGVDLVCDNDRGRVLDWCFTPVERRWLAAGPEYRRRPEQLWAAKEALYKACQRGEGFSPRRIDVTPGTVPRYSFLDPACTVRLQYWRVDQQFAVLAVASRACRTTGRLPSAA